MPELKEILLKKLDRILNPDFEKKYIWGLFTVGVLCVGVPRLIGFAGTVEWRHKEFFIGITLGGPTTTFLAVLGAACILFSIFLFHRKSQRDGEKDTDIVIEYEVEFYDDDKLIERRKTKVSVPDGKEDVADKVVNKLLERGEDVKEDPEE